MAEHNLFSCRKYADPRGYSKFLSAKQLEMPFASPNKKEGQWNVRDKGGIPSLQLNTFVFELLSLL